MADGKAIQVPVGSPAAFNARGRLIARAQTQTPLMRAPGACGTSLSPTSRPMQVRSQPESTCVSLHSTANFCRVPWSCHPGCRAVRGPTSHLQAQRYAALQLHLHAPLLCWQLLGC